MPAKRPPRTPPAQPGPLVGAHISAAGGHARALELAHTVGCEVVQVFTKNNMQWSAPPLTPAAIAEYRQVRHALGYDGRVFGHAGYLINLAGDHPGNLEKSRQSLLAELERCTALDLPFLVLHPGSHKGRGVEAGLTQVLASLEWVFARYHGTTRIALEFTAGQGDTLGRTIEEIAFLVGRSAQGARLGVCLDTCHLFAAGFDVRTPAGVDGVVRDFRQLLPWSKIVCVHLNDSEGELGSRRDRHALLGEGRIGWACFEHLLRHPALAALPLCLETPKGENNAHDIATLIRLKSSRLPARNPIADYKKSPLG